MRCLIVDDEEMAIKVIENHLQQIEGLEVIATCFNAIDAFTILQRQKIDLLFLDIQMPKMSGIGLLKSLSHKPHVILTTAHREFALEGFELDVVDYLLKPISFNRFLKAIGKVFRLENNPLSFAPPPMAKPPTEPAFFYIKSERQFIKILLEEVLYIESLRNHVKILTSNATYTTLLGISQMEEKLPPQHFIRIHRSFIVSLSKVSRFSQGNLMVGEQHLPIGQSYREQVLKVLEGNLL